MIAITANMRPSHGERGYIRGSEFIFLLIQDRTALYGNDFTSKEKYFMK